MFRTVSIQGLFFFPFLPQASGLTRSLEKAILLHASFHYIMVTKWGRRFSWDLVFTHCVFSSLNLRTHTAQHAGTKIMIRRVWEGSRSSHGGKLHAPTPLLRRVQYWPVGSLLSFYRQCGTESHQLLFLADSSLMTPEG